MKPVVLQLGENDCGFACLKMVAATLKRDRRYLEKLPPPKTDAFSFLELQEIGESWGLTVHGYEDPQLTSCPLGRCIALCHEDGRSHFVVIDQFTSKKVKVRDPASGMIAYTPAAFKRIYTGYCLHVSAPKNDHNHWSFPTYWCELAPAYLAMFICYLSLIMVLNNLTNAHYLLGGFFLGLSLVAAFLLRYQILQGVQKWSILYLTNRTCQAQNYPAYMEEVTQFFERAMKRGEAILSWLLFSYVLLQSGAVGLSLLYLFLLVIAYRLCSNARTPLKQQLIAEEQQLWRSERSAVQVATFWKRTNRVITRMEGWKVSFGVLIIAGVLINLVSREQWQIKDLLVSLASQVAFFHLGERCLATLGQRYILARTYLRLQFTTQVEGRLRKVSNDIFPK